jgi:hypothetical protein
MGDNRFFAMYIGVVVDRADPKRLGRVRVRIPGVIEPKSAWAWPLGSAGGGGKRLGGKRVPPLGAEVAVFFNQGDPDAPWYLTAQWGLVPNENGEPVTEIPGGNYDPDDWDKPESERRELTAEEAADVHVDETRDFVIVVDERQDKARYYIQHKLSGDALEYDYPSGGGWTLKSTTLLRLVADGLVSIEGSSIQINGRNVLDSPDPI